MPVTPRAQTGPPAQMTGLPEERLASKGDDRQSHLYPFNSLFFKKINNKITKKI